MLIETPDQGLFIFIREYNFIICSGRYTCRINNKILCTTIYEVDEFVVWTKGGMMYMMQ